MEIPILKGIVTDASPSVRTLYPKNLVPVIEQSGISSSYLKPAEGIVQNGTGPGSSRGAIVWNGVLYRVLGSSLCRIDGNGAVTVLGDVGDDGKQVAMDYSFDRIVVVSALTGYYWDGVTLTTITDPDAGNLIDVMWSDGYFFFIDDADNIVQTELLDPTQIDPLKYGSSEVDPDPIFAIKKIRNEPHVVNRNTIEVFRNRGGTGFVLQRINGAQIEKGAVGTHAVAEYGGALAFVGGGRHESPKVYVGASGQTTKISTREIDEILTDYTEAQLSEVLIENRIDRSSDFLYVHLPDKTIVHDRAASALAGEQIWHILSSSTTSTLSKYRAINCVWAYDKWQVGDPDSGAIGYLSDDIGSHWGVAVEWDFATPVIFNEANAFIIHEIELVSLTGSVAVGVTPKITTSSSQDGQLFGNERSIDAGTVGDRLKRLVWFAQGMTNKMRVQRFKGTSDAHITFLRLEVRIEALAA